MPSGVFCNCIKFVLCLLNGVVAVAAAFVAVLGNTTSVPDFCIDVCKPGNHLARKIVVVVFSAVCAIAETVFAFTIWSSRTGVVLVNLGVFVILAGMFLSFAVLRGFSIDGNFLFAVPFLAGCCLCVLLLVANRSALKVECSNDKEDSDACYTETSNGSAVLSIKTEATKSLQQ